MSNEPSKETVGRLFIDGDGVVWEQIAYTDKPTASFRRAISPTQRMSCVIGSMVAERLDLLSERDEQMFRADRP